MSTAYEVIVREVEARFRAEFDRRVEIIVADGRTAIDRAVTEATSHVGELVTAAVLDGPLSSSPVDAKADARERSWRTLVQGALATVVVGVGGTVGTAIASDSFSLTDWSDWKAAGIAAGTAAVAAGIAYVQRLVQPPKAQ